MENINELSLKILTIGESGVGKTCLLLRYTENKFISNYLSTIGIDYKEKNILIDNYNIKLKIWDTAGQERFRNITEQYYRGADGIILVFDLTDKNTFYKLKIWIDQILTNRNEVYIVLVGNKCDREDITISDEEILEFSNKYKLNFYKCSAMNNIGIEEPFLNLASQLLQIRRIQTKDTIVLAPKKKKKMKC